MLGILPPAFTAHVPLAFSTVVECYHGKPRIHQSHELVPLVFEGSQFTNLAGLGDVPANEGSRNKDSFPVRRYDSNVDTGKRGKHAKTG